MVGTMDLNQRFWEVDSVRGIAIVMMVTLYTLLITNFAKTCHKRIILLKKLISWCKPYGPLC